VNLFLCESESVMVEVAWTGLYNKVLQYPWVFPSMGKPHAISLLMLSSAGYRVAKWLASHDALRYPEHYEQWLAVRAQPMIKLPSEKHTHVLF
jgi:hypothetical protein